MGERPKFLGYRDQNRILANKLQFAGMPNTFGFQYSLPDIDFDFLNELKSALNPNAPIAQKFVDEVVFRRYQGVELSF